jgi:hypothetical protein
VLSPPLATPEIILRSYPVIAKLDPAKCKAWTTTIANK